MTSEDRNTLPMVSVVTREPQSRGTNIGDEQDFSNVAISAPGEDEEDVEGPELIGLGPLVNRKQHSFRHHFYISFVLFQLSAQRITIKQRIRLCEVLSLCTGCEVEKKYTIHGDSGETLYWAKEISNCCMRFLCGSARKLDITVTDQVTMGSVDKNESELIFASLP